MTPLIEIVEGEHFEIVDSGCWLWLRSCDIYGYGQIGRRRDGRFRVFKAHRVAYELFVGAIPAGKEIHHTCEVKRCVNPDHLALVTGVEHRRIANGQVKLDWPAVHAIRERYAEGDLQASIARDFGVDRASVSRIVNNKLWADKPPDDPPVSADARVLVP